MASETALRLVNDVRTDLATLARGLVDALRDGTVDPMEGLTLGMRGMSFAMTMLTLLKSTDLQTRHDILDVLEHGTLTMEP